MRGCGCGDLVVVVGLGGGLPWWRLNRVKMENSRYFFSLLLPR